LVFEVYRDDLEPFAQALVPIMRSAMKLVVPLDVELRCGDNWEELKRLDIKLPALAEAVRA
jgi:DNA polymerase I-like protein with 3'-5' exonuclease and polymerase domains